MRTFLITRLFVLLLLTTTIVISKDKAKTELAMFDENAPLKRNITCLCTEDEQCDSNSRTCQLSRQHHMCYESWALEFDGVIRVTAGCAYNDYFFLRIWCAANSTQRSIICCSQRDYCNDLDAYSKDIRQGLLATPVKASHPASSDRSSKLPLILIASAASAVVLLGICIFIYIKQKNYREKKNGFTKPNGHTDGYERTNIIQRLVRRFQRRRGCTGLNDSESIPSDQSLTALMDDLSVTTVGPALPLLMQRTLARQITLGECIGTGRYGSVHRGTWREDNIAVKIFSANDERSWFREIDIYQTVCLRHENILGYIAADNMDASTYTQLWLVTEYHENGSVYDYLMNHTITVPILIKMMLSIASGLCHLHLPIDSTNGKVAIAHRDLKTKNILVKRDLSCCIADLGLAVKEVRTRPKPRKDLLASKASNQEHVVIDIQANSRVGTQRYMAPEVLDGTMNDRSFDSFKAADIYALGLVYWEMLRRCRTSPTDDDADAYQVPYEDVLPNSNKIEEIRDVVCTQKIRPLLSQRWLNHQILRPMYRLCEELWNEDPSCRLNSLNIKKQLKKQMELVENDLSNTNLQSEQQSSPNNGPWTA